MIRYRTRSIRLRRAATLLAVLALAGCSTLSSWIPTIPVPSFGWFSSSKKLGPLPEYKPVANSADRLAGCHRQGRPRTRAGGHA